MLAVANLAMAIDFGIKAGYNASRLSASVDTLSAGTLSGFHAGAFGRLGGRLFFQPELIYTFQGGEFTSNVNTSNWQKIRIGSLDIPLLAGFKLIKGEKINLRIQAGPVPSFVVNKSVTDAEGYTGPVTSESIRNINWYIQAGAGIDLWFVALDIRYEAGLNQVIGEISEWRYQSMNNLLVISAGFKIF